MNRRALLSVINISVAATTLAVWFLLPRYAEYALYAFFGWFVISLSTIWIARGSPRGPLPSSGGAASPAAAGAAAPGAVGRPLAGGQPAPAEIGFCIYCAADLPPGAPQCPGCGHAVARLG